MAKALYIVQAASGYLILEGTKTLPDIDPNKTRCVFDLESTYSSRSPSVVEIVADFFKKNPPTGGSE